uniref:Uncharacterized protein n=1 Tax=Ananas comosus var. bracteatus TaxID=296719 RepID=A0A6V7QHC7_ANACO|nr:unnamed protein product [Ananas comosus var. bracteatus]
MSKLCEICRLVPVHGILYRYISPNWAVFAQRDRSLPSWDRSLAANPKTSVREPVSPCAGPVSHCENAFGNRSRPPGTGCLRLPQHCSLGNRSLIPGTGPRE